ncbi:MAG: asparaginase [Acidimicrobiales bacterium]
MVIRMWRGDAVESIHRGAWVATDTQGSVLASVGDPYQLTFPRSATKAFQALPLLLSGAAEAFGFDDGDVALAMASHSGESMHVERVLASLERLGLTEDALQCGPQQPMAPWSTEGKRRASMNCSGKHVGFLAVARQLDADPAGYLDPDGAVQQAVYEATKRITGADDDELSLATDGCSAPTFRMPLARLAQGIARIANPDGIDDDLAAACRRMTTAAAAYPELIGGSKHRSDTDLIRVTEGRLFAKVGAEAVLVVGEVGGNAAYAMKIDDGGERAIAPFMLDVLVAGGRLSADERDQLTEWNNRDRSNWDGLVVGRVDIVETATKGR